MKTYLFSILACIGLMGCENNPSEMNDHHPIDLPLKAEKLIEASNAFGFELFQCLNQNPEPGKNLMVSPLSVTQALSMAMNGAVGDTKTEMESMLHVNGLSSVDYNQLQELIRNTLLNADTKTDVNIANSIWCRQGSFVQESFLDVNRRYYDAQVEVLDFEDGESAKKTINNWVNEKTKGKIPEIVQEVTPYHYMFLINAIYFYGCWKYEFDPVKTTDCPFVTETNSTVQVDMMQNQAAYRTFLDDEVSVVELPYGNGHYSMVLMLPLEHTLSEFISTLDSASWKTYMDGLSEMKVHLYLPKFTFSVSSELNSALIELGMPTAFSEYADFAAIDGIGEIYISKVMHKTYIDVDEKGTEAAAVTSVEFEVTSINPNDPVTIAFDHPFVFAITEKDSGAILFLGKVSNPKEAS